MIPKICTAFDARRASRATCAAALVGIALVALPAREVAAADAAAGKKVAAETAPVSEETWYASSIGGNESGVVTVNYWSKGSNLRAEVIVKGYRITTIVNGKFYHVYNEVLGAGLTIERAEPAVAQDAKRGRPFANEFDSLRESGAEKIDEKTMGESDFKFDLYQLSDNLGRRKLLVTQVEPHLPVRIESYVRSTGDTSFVEYSGWDRGLLISDSFFEPPTHIDFEQMTHAQYVEGVAKGPVGPAPVFYGALLHGERE